MVNGGLSGFFLPSSVAVRSDTVDKRTYHLVARDWVKQPLERVV